MRIKLLTLLSMLTMAMSVNAGIVNHDIMYAAYLANNMQKWGTELKSYTAHKDLTLKDKFEICNYLYGYVATILNSSSDKEIDWWLNIWKGYLDELENENYNLTEIHVFRSAWNAYQYTKHPTSIKYAIQSLKESDKAYKMDKNNALALSLKGNIKFYMPKMAGGDKKEAKIYYQKAIAAFAKAKNDLYRWNATATKLCLAQTYEKLGEKELAISYCKEILKSEPTFKYLKDVYLPSINR